MVFTGHVRAAQGMARVTLLDEKLRPELAPLAAKIGGARGRLINLYRMLLHSPGVAEAWLAFNNAIRFEAGVEERLRELVILRIALLNGSDYVLKVHRDGMAQKAGVSDAEIAALADWRGSAAFDDRERALLDYVDAMTRTVEVPDPVFAALRAHFDERRIVELTVLAGCYNMHTRVLRALQVDPEERS